MVDAKPVTLDDVRNIKKQAQEFVVGYRAKTKLDINLGITLHQINNSANSLFDTPRDSVAALNRQLSTLRIQDPRMKSVIGEIQDNIKNLNIGNFQEGKFDVTPKTEQRDVEGGFKENVVLDDPTKSIAADEAEVFLKTVPTLDTLKDEVGIVQRKVDKFIEKFALKRENNPKMDTALNILEMLSDKLEDRPAKATPVLRKQLDNFVKNVDKSKETGNDVKGLKEDISNSRIGETPVESSPSQTSAFTRKAADAAKRDFRDNVDKVNQEKKSTTSYKALKVQ